MLILSYDTIQTYMYLLTTIILHLLREVPFYGCKLFCYLLISKISNMYHKKYRFYYNKKHCFTINLHLFKWHTFLSRWDQTQEHVFFLQILLNHLNTLRFVIHVTVTFNDYHKNFRFWVMTLFNILYFFTTTILHLLKNIPFYLYKLCCYFLALKISNMYHKRYSFYYNKNFCFTIILHLLKDTPFYRV